jgi:hypothetical protein
MIVTAPLSRRKHQFQITPFFLEGIKPPLFMRHEKPPIFKPGAPPPAAAPGRSRHARPSRPAAEILLTTSLRAPPQSCTPNGAPIFHQNRRPAS